MGEADPPTGKQSPPPPPPPPEKQTPVPQVSTSLIRILRDTVNKRAVRIPLECILVPHCYGSSHCFGLVPGYTSST